MQIRPHLRTIGLGPAVPRVKLPRWITTEAMHNRSWVFVPVDELY